MKVWRGGFLTLMLVGWLWLIPVFPILSPGPAAAKALPVLLEFGRKGCNICQRSESIVQAVKDQYPGRFEVRRFYINQEQSWFYRYKVAIVPSQVFLDAEGREVYRHAGVFKIDDLIRKLRELKFIK
ncbi:MAG: thioredoxin family protein [Deltaproteobacteria bacterium]